MSAREQTTDSEKKLEIVFPKRPDNLPPHLQRYFAISRPIVIAKYNGTLTKEIFIDAWHRAVEALDGYDVEQVIFLDTLAHMAEKQWLEELGFKFD